MAAAGAGAGAGAPNYTVLGSGGYGVVFKPALPNNVDGKLTEFPANVTKVFYKPGKLEEAFDAINTLQHIISEPNAGHRANRYTRKYYGRNLPEKLFREIRSKIRKEAKTNLTPDSPLSLMRTPYLGVDITHIKTIYTAFQRIPFGTILTQFQKLIHQTADIAALGYGHFDIRTSNVMIDPQTGVFTLIDFDWLKPLEELFVRYKFGFYSNPPEALLRDKWNAVMTKATHIIYEDPSYEEEITPDLVKSFIRPDKFDHFMYWNIQSFPVAWMLHGIADSNTFTDRVLDALVDNTTYLCDQAENYPSYDDVFKRIIMPTVDNYGLALTLLEFIGYVYPMPYAPDTLGHFLSKNGDPYSPSELAKITVALTKLLNLFRAMSSLFVEERPLPETVLEEIDAIVAEFNDGPPVPLLPHAHMPAPPLPQASIPALTALPSLPKSHNIKIKSEKNSIIKNKYGGKRTRKTRRRARL